MKGCPLARWTGGIVAILTLISSNLGSEAAVPCSPISGTITYERIKSEITACDLRSIDELLPLLPEDYRRRYLLMYQSRSLQYASMRSPRTILYGTDGKMVMAFSGDPTKPGYNSLETMEWDAVRARFVMRSIEFPAAGAAKSERPRFDEGQEKCVGCHQDPPRPNWDPYNFWRGAYGSLSRSGVDIIRRGTPEDKGYQDFLASSRASGRYRFLPESVGQLKDFAGKPVDLSKYPDEYAVPNGAVADPNGQFNELMGNLNLQRIVAMLKANPYFDKFKYAIVGTVRGCSSIRSFFPAVLQRSVPDQEYVDLGNRMIAQYKDRSAAALRFNQPGVDSKGQPDEDRTPTPFDAQVPFDARLSGYAITQWKYLADRIPGIDFWNWSMGFESADATFATGGAYFFQQNEGAWRDVVDSVIASLPKEAFSEGPDGVCLALQARSRAALEGFKAQPVSQGAQPWSSCYSQGGATTPAMLDVMSIFSREFAAYRRPRSLFSCIGCHSGPNAEGPEIPFHDAVALGARLAREPRLRREIEARLRSPEASQRMPKDRTPLAPGEISELIDYFRGL